MKKYRNAKYDILTVYEKSRMKSKILALKAAAMVPQTPRQLQVRCFPTDSQIRRKDVTQRQTSQAPVILSECQFLSPPPAQSQQAAWRKLYVLAGPNLLLVGARVIDRWHCRSQPFPAVLVCRVPLIPSSEPQTQLLLQIVLEKLCRSVRKCKIIRYGRDCT